MAKAKQESRQLPIYFAVAFLIMITLKTFVIEARWFDYVYYFFILTALGVFGFVQFKQRKWVYAGIASILFLWYLYGFNFI